MIVLQSKKLTLKSLKIEWKSLKHKFSSTGLNINKTAKSSFLQMVPDKMNIKYEMYNGQCTVYSVVYTVKCRVLTAQC